MPRLILVIALLSIIASSASGCGRTSGAAAGRADGLSPEQREVAAMPVPVGVDAQLWEELQDALIAALGDSQAGTPAPLVGQDAVPVISPPQRAALPGRTASAPPTGAGAQAELLYIADGSELSWRYASPGDYDQNGEVNGADLAPLAIHIGKRAESLALGFPHASIESLVDGDGNGEINAADIVPIAANFRNRVEGYRVYSGDLDAYPQPPNSPNGPGAELAQLVLHGESELTPGERRRFSVAVGDAETTRRFWARPFEGEADGPASNNVVVPSASNQSPTAHLIAGPPGGATPFGTTLTAAGSVDPDGQIVRYEWDLDGDGAFEYDGGDTPSTPLWFYAPGSFAPRVRVTDDDGAQAVASVTINVTEGAKWHTQELDEASNGTVLVVEGKPALIYNKTTSISTSDVVYRQANDVRGVTWKAPVQAYDPPAMWAYGAAVIGGLPAISFGGNFHPATTLRPRYRAALNVSGTSWAEPQWVVDESFTSYGPNRLLREVAGHPAVTFQGQNYLRYARALDPAGNTWSPPVELGFQATFHSFEVIDGRPALAYRHANTNSLVFFSAADEFGAVWNYPVVIGHTTSPFVQIVEADTHPAIAFYDGVLEALYFARADDREGRTWPVPHIAAFKTGARFSLSNMPDGRPAMVYLTRDTDRLLFMAANDPQGNTWSAPMEVDIDVHSSQLSLECGLMSPVVLFETPSGTVSPTHINFAGYY